QRIGFGEHLRNDYTWREVADLKRHPYPEIILHEVIAVGRIGESVLIFKRVTIEKFGDHPLLSAVKLGVAYLYTGIQPDNKIIQVKPKACTGADGQLPEKTIELKFTPGIQFVFINSPNVSEICKRGCFEFGAKNI